MTPQVGKALRAARTQQGIELSEVERATKIRVKFVQAMEDDRWEALPAPVYARGFLSTYARFLGLDDEPLVEEYRRTVEGADRPEPIPAGVVRPGSIPPRRSAKPRGLLLLGSVAAVLLGVVVVALISLGDGGSDRGGREAAATGDGADRSSPSTTAQPPTTDSDVSLELRATADVWVCMVDADGSQVVNGEILAAEQARGPFVSRRFMMTFGNGSVEMTVDGQPIRVPPLAEPLGFEVTASGSRRLPPASRPTCA